MTQRQVRRRLAAILAADIAGYSRMMEADEAGTVTVMKQIWSEIFDPAVAARHGRTVKTMGDGALAEFASAVEAVECALAIQRAMAARNAVEPPVEFRIGVNLGDIVIENDDILGDGVNIAARLEQQAPQSGILISDVVHAQVRGKIEAGFIDGGEVKLKNIERPLKVWRWTDEAGAARAIPLTAADTPSIAVLPFTAMSSDPEQEFFADGLVEDILTTLSKLSGLAVIARHSSFAYKGRHVDVRQVARELGVRYVLEGSVRKAGERIRITAQLIDASTGVHIWAERFDRSVDDIFAVQDEITLRLATEMQVRFTEGEQARLRYTTTSNVEAWSIWIQGLRHVRGPVTAENQIHARRCWEQALALDPSSAPLNAMLGFTHYADARFGWWDEREIALEKAATYAERALRIDPNTPDAYRTVAGILLMRSRFDDAVKAALRAVELCPSLPDGLVFASFALQSAGRASEGISLIERAMTLSPTYPANYLGQLGNAYRLVGRNDEAMAAFLAYHARSPGFGLADIVMLQAQSGQLEAARKIAAELVVARPDFTVSSWLRTQFRSDAEQMAADLASLRAAGVPE